MIFTKKIRAKLDRNCPLFRDDETELAGVEDCRVLTKIVTTGSATGLELFKANAPFKFEIVDVIIQARGASTNGTIKLTDGTNDITDAIVCAVDKTIVRAGTIDDVYSTIEKGGTLDVVCAGDTVGNTKALVTVVVKEVE